jgi:methylated-DNA-[protein]-cysteine S-methyltransferase
MAIATKTLAKGQVTTWAGTTRVTASPMGVRQVWLPDWHGAPPKGSAEPCIETSPGGSDAAESHLQQALGELADYFIGQRRDFTVALDLEGPEFFQTIWRAVARVPYGETRAYGEIARAIGAPEASRAVGTANGANPIAPFVPCHRIVGSDGRLTGYGPGLPLKRRLLEMEDALPHDAADFDPWIARLHQRLGAGDAEDASLFLGVRVAGVYCRPDCSRPRGSLRPGRIFHSVEEARAAGYRPCDRCQPDSQPAPWLIP